MGVINLAPYKPVPGTVGDANAIANAFTTLEAVLNGGIDNNNFAAGKIFDPAKLMQNGATALQVLAWDTGTATWKPTTVGSLSVAKYTTLIDLVSSASEFDFLAPSGHTVPAGSMGANGVIRATIIGDTFNNTGGAGSWTPRVYWGGTKIFDAGAFTLGTAGVRAPFKITVIIANLGATNSQDMHGVIEYVGTATSITTGFGGGLSPYSMGAPALAKDTTLAQVLRVTIQGTNSAVFEIRSWAQFVEAF